MMVIDSQVHIWAANTPERPWMEGMEKRAHMPVPLTADLLWSHMREAGVTHAILVPPSLDGDRNDLCLAAAQAHPDRFAVMGRLDTEAPEARAAIATWRSQQGMLGLRFTFHTPLLAPLLTEGRMDWVWREAQAAGVPVMVYLHHDLLHFIDRVAERYPRLKIVIDHLALPYLKKDEAAFAEFDKLLPLAKRPNVAVKASTLPSHTSDVYPYRRTHPYLRRVYDAYGPQRVFWATDFTAMPCTYRQAIAMFTEEIPWFTAEDKEWIMGRAVCEWLGWALPC
jgi:predicted TIM-barrel fold metal-dependent hydrolase